MSGLPDHRFRRLFLLRTPLLPYNVLDLCGGDVARQRADLFRLADLPEISEAIYLSSPSLYRELETQRKAPDCDSYLGQLVEYALVKYISRMATRPTPARLFAGVAIGEVAEEHGRDHLVIGFAREHRRQTRVDDDVLFDLAMRLAQNAQVRRTSVYWPNATLTWYSSGARYVETMPSLGDQTRRAHQLVSVESTPYLRSTIERAQSGAKLSDLVTALLVDHPEATLEEAQAYVDELAQAQILIPGLGTTSSASEPIDEMVAHLATAGLDHMAAGLTEVRAKLEHIDSRGVGAGVGAYTSAVENLETLLASISGPESNESAERLHPARAFRVDVAMAMAEPATIGADVVTEVEGAIEVLRRLAPRSENPPLSEFCRTFRVRWGEREMPLGHVLDEKDGIVFPAKSGPGLEEPRGSEDGRDAWLQALLRRAVVTRREVVLDEGDLGGPEGVSRNSATACLPDVLSATVRLGRRDGALEILLMSIDTPMDVGPLGRYRRLNANIDEMLKDELTFEATLHPGALLADVAPLIGGRNARSFHPVREHEIACLGLGGPAPGRQIRIDDLMVSVHGERVILRSRRLGREIVPRLRRARDVTLIESSCYRFFAALQSQGTDSISWSWAELANSSWLPRVRVGKVVVAREQWVLDERSLQELAEAWKGETNDAQRARVFAAAHALRGRLALPRYVALLDSDNEQFVDFHHMLSVYAFVAAAVYGHKTRLVEVLPRPESAPIQGPTGRHACEAVLTFVRKSESG